MAVSSQLQSTFQHHFVSSRSVGCQFPKHDFSQATSSLQIRFSYPLLSGFKLIEGTPQVEPHLHFLSTYPVSGHFCSHLPPAVSSHQSLVLCCPVSRRASVSWSTHLFKVNAKAPTWPCYLV